jgi:hypothetical protein
MKNKLMKRSLCIALVVVMMLGLAVINASACSCPTDYWDPYSIKTFFNYGCSYEHNVMEEDRVYCHLCQDDFLTCTHWYSENHDFVTYCLGYIDSIQMYEYERYCLDCGYGEIYYLPY